MPKVKERRCWSSRGVFRGPLARHVHADKASAAQTFRKVCLPAPKICCNKNMIAEDVAVAAAPGGDAAIACFELSKRFGELLAVDSVTLSVRPGEVLALLGPNGAGKTTTVRMLCGLIAPSFGRIHLGAKPLPRGDESFRRTMGILTEQPGLYERLSLWTNLEFFARLQGMSAAHFAQRSQELLRRFGLWERRNERISNFSKGMKQKTAIVRAILHDPSVIFLDEPSSGLDPEAAREVREMISDLKRQGRTVLLTTHRLTEAEELADRVAIIKTRLLAIDTVAGLRSRIYGRRIAITVRNRHDELVRICAALPFVQKVERAEFQLRVSLSDLERETPELVSALVNAGAAILEVSELKQSLESVYLHLINQEFSK